MKVFYSLIIFIVLISTNLSGADEESYWDKVKSGSDALLDMTKEGWDKTKEYSNTSGDALLDITKEGWDKTKEYSNTSGDALLDITKEGWELTKEYSNIGKNIVIEQTLLNGINVLTDNSKVKVVLLDINDTTNYIDMVFYLKGEDKNLTVKIKDFTWGVSKDDKHIVFETLDINLDIEWINYLLVDAIKRDGGRLVLPNKATTFSLLFSIKPNIKIKKALPTKDKFDFVHYEYDKSFFNINKFEVINGNIVVDIFTKGGKNISCNIKSYILRTANRKSIIALQDLKFGVCNKPWIQSIIEKQNREIHFDFTDKLYQLFNEKVE